jgi:transposase
MTQVLVMTGPVRRRRWDNGVRNEILAAAFSPGAVVAEVARRFDVASSLIYKWRRQALPVADKIVARFSPAVVVEDPTDGSAPGIPAADPELTAPVAITVEFSAGVRVRIDAAAPVALVTAALLALQ